MDQKQVIKLLREYKLVLSKHFKLDQMFLYGSYARQSASADSDIDVAIILKEFNDNYFDVVPKIWKLRKSIDPRIEPHVFELGKDRSGLLSEIMRTGIAI
jgi:predicted nucleotidyltransferase